jgi:hypothetical protein
MPEVAPISKSALVMLMKIATFFRFQDWLVYLQLFDSVSEEATSTIPTVSRLDICFAKFNLSLTAIA